MKKYLLLILLLILSLPIFSDTLNFSNEYISIDFEKNESFLYISQIRDVQNKVNYIKNPSEKPLWQFKVKKDKDYTGAEYSLTPDMGQLFINKKKNNLTLTWKDVKSSEISDTFDVVCNIQLNKGDSYWKIHITPGKNYGIWNIDYPHIPALDTQDGDKFANPMRGGNIISEFSHKDGMLWPCSEDDRRYTDLGYYLPVYMQWVSLSKGDCTLYVCPNDPNNNFKTFNYTLFKPNELDLTTVNYPSYMSEAGHEYNQDYGFNISVFKGDDFDACKKYRAWGIANNYGPFMNGKMETRTDLPDWWKKSSVTMQWNVNEPQCVDSLIYAMNFLNIPMLVHAYMWNASNEFDTRYPKWLPVRDGFLKDAEKLKSMGYKIMPYTNGHLVDTALSPYYKKYGKEMLALNEKGEDYYEGWSANLGARNACACPDSIYKYCYYGEVMNIMKELNFDALYSDQVGASMPNMCFNPAHKHPMGGGDTHYKAYKNLINNLRNSLNKIKGEPVVFTTEDSSDPYPFDGWLRCNEDLSRNADTPYNTIVYSGYVVSFGSNYYPKEFENEFSAINKTSVTFTKGIQPGWSLGNRGQFEKYPTFAKHFKNMTLARHEASEYFNLGEMVRPVKITSPIPTKTLYWKNIYGESTKEHKMIRTCSYNYKGKSLVSFINSSDESVKVDWEASPKDLYLSSNKNIASKRKYNNKISYKITYEINAFYPKEIAFENNSSKDLIKSSFTIAPLETVMFEIKPLFKKIHHKKFKF